MVDYITITLREDTYDVEVITREKDDNFVGYVPTNMTVRKYGIFDSSHEQYVKIVNDDGVAFGDQEDFITGNSGLDGRSLKAVLDSDAYQKYSDSLGNKPKSVSTIWIWVIAGGILCIAAITKLIGLW